LQPEFFCKEVIDSCLHESEYQILDPEDYIERVALQNIPAEIANNDFIDKLYETLAPTKIITMVQFTDVHLDLEYEENSHADCNLVLCCRKENGFPIHNLSEPALAEKWFTFGEMGCDIPERTFLSMV
jgi:hypothetical protein